LTTFRDDWNASRRLFLLRLLVEVRQANESVLYKSAAKGGFSSDTRNDIREDLDHLCKTGCAKQEFLNDVLRVISITERGEDAAYGRIAVAGVEQTPWDR